MPVRRVLLLAAGVFFAPMVGQPAVAGLRIMGSPPHRANILRPQFHRVGIGVVDGGMHGKMFTQNFAD